LKVANRKTAFQNENKINDNFETLSFGFQIKTDVGRRAFLHFYRFDAKTEKSEKLPLSLTNTYFGESALSFFM
jgi:hypothetical protein